MNRRARSPFLLLHYQLENAVPFASTRERWGQRFSFAFQQNTSISAGFSASSG